MDTPGLEEDGEFWGFVGTLTMAALRAAHNRQAPRFAGRRDESKTKSP